MVVVLDQACAGETGGEVLDYFLHLIVFQPRVDDLELLAQDRKHYNLCEGLTIAVARVLGFVEVKNFPL